MASQMSAGCSWRSRLEHVHMPDRHRDLRDERDVERAARVAGALQSAGVGQRDA